MTAPTGELAGAFCARLPAGVSVEASALPALGARLYELYAAGKAGLPHVELTAARFAEHLAEHLDADLPVLEALARLHAADLYLALGCLTRSDRAIAAFEAGYMPAARGALGRMNLPDADAEEVLQSLREKLLVGAPDRPARIAEYAGRGELKGWLAAAAVRMALNRLRNRKREVLLDEDELLEVPASSDDPEVERIRALCQAEFRLAFQAAAGALEPRERVLLRYHFIDGLTIDDLAALHRVHRATAARWLAAARRRLADGTRAQLARRLALGASELESLLRVVRSQLDLSIRQYL